MNTWIIVTEDGPIAGMVAVARSLGGDVTAAVIGPRTLADAVAAIGPDSVRWFATTDAVPPEAYADLIADEIAASGPRVVLALAHPAARVLLTVSAARLGAVVVNRVRRLTVEADVVVITRPTAESRAVETLEVVGTLAAVFDGEDVAPGSPVVATVIEVPVADSSFAMRIVETTSDGGSGGLAQADRVVSVGLGVRSKDDLALVQSLAIAARAEIACSLPLADDMRWFDSTHVVGSSSHQISPELYIAIGISGQPQHMAGVRDAKVVVAINNDPDASIFTKCDYGVVGDLYQIVPALTAALTRI